MNLKMVLELATFLMMGCWTHSARATSPSTDRAGVPVWHPRHRKHENNPGSGLATEYEERGGVRRFPGAVLSGGASLPTILPTHISTEPTVNGDRGRTTLEAQFLDKEGGIGNEKFLEVDLEVAQDIVNFLSKSGEHIRAHLKIVDTYYPCASSRITSLPLLSSWFVKRKFCDVVCKQDEPGVEFNISPCRYAILRLFRDFS